ncbi:unnamed protein product [Bursaphelenchus xylophilus]|uniref:(pine wood nematode) hypothetical protein n=1 Tax=Bursaphelenchus xylophilus TaxID=6326 RepID=A0A1I7RNR1_BURXY|nr:unnamed protein product [Bursaphelenchus xylophilus]CAG9124232.1 unnamed protein product [Bursaphelenchus xylophilus]
MRWTVSVGGGPKRVNHAACAIGTKIYSFGGYCSGETPTRTAPLDVHMFDTETMKWTRVFGEEPEVRYSSKSLSSEVSIFEDEVDWDTDMSYEEDMTQGDYDWHYNPLLNDGLAIVDDSNDFQDVPFMRYGHTAVAYNGKAYIWGGRNDEYGASQRLYEYDPEKNSWQSIPPANGAPPARDGHTAVIYGHEMIIFGGFEEENQRFSQECYSYNFVTREWKLIKTTKTPPQYRDFHAACIFEDKMYVFGGRCDERGQYHSNADFYDDVLRYLDLKTLEWIEPVVEGDLPEGRRSNAMWVQNGMLYMFGGYNSKSDEHYGDLRRFNPKTGEWKRLSLPGDGPSARRRQCSVMVGEKMYLFGGTMPHPIKKNGGLLDLGDLFVLDYGNVLTSICLDVLDKNGLLEMATRVLPQSVLEDLRPNLYCRNFRWVCTG